MYKFFTAFLVLSLLFFPAWGQITPGSPQYDQLKREGKLVQPTPTPYNGKYPNFSGQWEKRSGAVSPEETQPLHTARTNIQAIAFPNPQPVDVCQVENPALNASFTALPANDDVSTESIALDFSFQFFGDSYTSVYLNNNGNISFGSAYAAFTPTGFPTTEFSMIAPFWADVDTRGAGSGLMYYKKEATRLTVIWYQVGYFDSMADKTNTFKLIITNGNDPLIGVGNNVAFVYGDMEWTTGRDSGGSGGFGGTAATVGFNKGTGVNACYFFQEGRFDKPGNEFAGRNGNSGVDYLDNKCFFYNTAALLSLGADFKTSPSICATKFYERIYNPHNYTILGISWDFGDGTTSTDRNPIHAYASPGTYQATLTVQYQFGDCTSPLTFSVQKEVIFNPSNEVFKDTTFTIGTAVLEDVISASAVTFADAWSLKHRDDALADKHAFANGAQGVWRAAGSYAYEEVREASAPVRTATDGTYPLEGFNWEFEDLNAIPKWRKTNTITEYSPYSYELENRDILNRHTAALYDYGGQFPSAKGVNMQHQEMAFTSFEYADGGSSGNWRLSNDPVPLVVKFRVNNGREDYALIEASMAELEEVSQVELEVRIRLGTLFSRRIIKQNKLFCKKPYPANPDWTLVQFEQYVLLLPWRGTMIKRNAPVPLLQANLDATVAHTGKKSLKITEPLTLKQELLELESGKSYQVSAWVSVNDQQVSTPVLADDLGVSLALKDKDGTVLGSASFVPAGRVIEGWQQLKGELIAPAGKSVLEITFKPGSRGTAWYDDLRLHPTQGNMQSYVYDLNSFRLQATLDENNFAAFYYYDEEGRLYLVKKETEAGIKTITETVTHVPGSSE